MAVALLMTSPDFGTELGEQWDMLYRSAIHWCRGSAADAEDLVQTTMTRAWKYRDKFQAGTNLKGWLLTMMKREWIRKWAADKARTQGLADTSIDELADVLVDAADVESQAIAGVEVEQALALVAGDMPAYYSEVVRLVVVEDKSYQEAAEQLGIPLGTAMSGVYRARHRLRTLQEETSAD